ncbi:MAG: FAD:protein transferase [Solirubrobacterales bacterium]|nr:FAD:protein transferase [Solirubrobacterales bacterium]
MIRAEAGDAFPCFGASATIRIGSADHDAAAAAAAAARRRLLSLHDRFSRFLPESELCRINDEPRATVRASDEMRLLARGTLEAERLSGGLVDATGLEALEQAGYRSSLVGATPLPLPEALAEAPERRPARPPAPRARGRLTVDDASGTISRSPGLRLDSGGIAKGLAADLIAASLEGHGSYAVNCGGDMRVGGLARAPRLIEVEDPFGGRPVHRFHLARGAVATSGIGRRSWARPDGAPAHHLLDPSSGQPAFTGVVQATALAPAAFLAEVLAKLAVLRGPQAGGRALPYGGVLVLDDGSARLVGSAVRRRC